MPIQLQVSPLHRLVVVVARGHVASDEIARTTEELADPNVRHYGKIIDVSEATSELTVEQVERIAAGLRGRVGSPVRGPIAFVIDPNRRGFADDFADATEGDRPIKLFRSLHEARKWLQQTMDEELRSGGTQGVPLPR